MASEIEFKASVGKDLRRLDSKESERVLRKTEETLEDDPDAGEPLTREFAGLFRLRIGRYRVVYAKTGRGVLILRIAHRKYVSR